MAKNQPVAEQDRVDFKHPDYDELKEKRDLYHRILSGADALIDNAEEDLPQLPAETDDSYEERCAVATLNNYTKKALKVLSGLVFAEEINTEGVPEQIQTIFENVDKQGNHLNIFARATFEEMFSGYCAVLVDKPSTQVETVREQGALNLDPYCRLYSADSIWNWQYRINPISQVKELSLLVLREDTPEPDGKYGQALVTRYREFRLVDNRPTVTVWLVVESEEPVIEKPLMVLNQTNIPVEIFGDVGQQPILYDIARKNREHFQTYSIYKSDMHKTCVPQRVIEGGTPESIAPMAADITLFPPKDHKAYFIEVAGASLETVRKALQDIASDIATMTNSIIANKDAKAEMTATGELIDNTAETAELRAIAEGFKDSLERVLGFLAEWLGLGVDKGGEIILGTQWNKVEAEAEEAADRKARSDEASIAATKAKA